MCSPRLLRAAAVAVLASALFVASSRVGAEDAPPPNLDADLYALSSKADAGPVEAWIIFESQPAARIADDLRPDYERQIDSARAPALAALDRIEPLLPPPEERAALGVAGVMALERSLLGDEGTTAVRAAHDDVKRLVLEMRSRVLSTARPLCDAEQDPVAAWIASLPDARVEARTVVLDAMIAKLPASALPDLARAFPNVRRIARAKLRSVSLDTSVPAIGAASWTSQSYAGGGESVAVVDTGIDASHPAFTTSSSAAVVTAASVHLSTAAANYTNFSSYDSASSSDDYHGHGTHCGGIVASNDSTYTGVAPGAGLMNAKCFFRDANGNGNAYDPDIVAATDWAISAGANVLSCSFGGGGTSDGTDPLTIFYDAVVDVSGLSVAMAAGNSGSTGAGSIDLPGDGFNVVTVGAFDHNGSSSYSDDSLAWFSSLGPCADGRRKPDLCAPGVGIISTAWNWETSNDFISFSGTSMATPHVAGGMALLLSYATSWRPDAVKALLSNSCHNTSPVSGAPSSSWGCGELDLAQAYSERTHVVTPTAFTSSGVTAHYYKLGSLAAGARQTIAWNRAATYFGGSPSGGGGSALSLVNLDLRLYDGSSGSQVAASASTVDSVEQTSNASALSNAVLKVVRTGNFPSGKTSQIYSLATGANAATAAVVPTLVFTATTGPTDVAGSTQFTLTATVKNTGDLRAPAPSLTLTVPTGFSLASGVNATQSVSSLDPFSIAGATATASWTVVSGTSSLVGTFSVAASTTGYGATFTAASSATRNVKVDATPPSANAGNDITLAANTAAGRTITLDASASTDNNAANGLTYAWDTDADGDFTDTPGSATGVAPSVVFSRGQHVVTLHVTDYVGNVGSDTVVVTVTDAPPTADAGPDKNANEGSSVSFNGSNSSDLEGPIQSYSWNFGDGSAAASGATPSHVFRNNGTYTVTLTVTDTGQQTASDTAIVTVANVAPTANAGAPKSGNEGSGITLSGSATDPGLDDVLTYSWNFGDGSAAGSGATPTHVWRNQGTYTATLTVTDGDGGTNSSSTTVTVANVAPTADAGAPRTGNEGSAILLLGSATDPGLDDVLTYSWTLGDGATSNLPRPSHVYRNQGTYTATLTVTDGDGGSSVSSTTVTVFNVAPTANAGGAKSGNEGSAISFVGTATDPGLDDVLTYSWNFGDGSAPVALASTSHVYAQNGVYTATLTVSDGDGGVGQSTAQVVVINVAPTANAGSNKSGVEGATFSFAGTAYDPGVLDVLSYSWDFGDGATATGASASHVYKQDGTYTATLTVSDGEGGVGTSTITVTVQNVAPVATAGADASSNEGDAVDFAGSATDAGVLDVLTYSWDFGDASPAVASATTSHVYAQDGVYVATLTVTDDAGASSTSKRTITVANVAPDLELPSALDIHVGDLLHVALAPTDASAVDAANLAVTWKILDAADAVVLAGQGLDVSWPADRAFEGALVVDVADDHVSIERRATVSATTPPIGDTLPATLAQNLPASLERSVLLDVLAGRALVAKPKTVKSAGKKFAAAKSLLAKKGLTSGLLVARLTALSAACAAGAAPPADDPFDVPTSLGTIDELLHAATRVGFPEKWTGKLLASLVNLRYAERLGAAKKTAAAKKAAGAIASKLPATGARDWFINSIAAQ